MLGPGDPETDQPPSLAKEVGTACTKRAQGVTGQFDRPSWVIYYDSHARGKEGEVAARERCPPGSAGRIVSLMSCMHSGTSLHLPDPLFPQLQNDSCLPCS